MTRRAFLRKAGKSAIRRIGFLLAAVLILSGCGRNVQVYAVKAVAAGVPSLAPFFDERSGLGRDTTLRAGRAPGGLQAGDTPGLYGGSRTPTVCDVARLKQFLTDPHNAPKAKVWAQVEGIDQREIPEYLDRLTPVLLRHDTLVQNHDFKKGRATPFDSLLQAGIAVLVDERGQPTVKCSCGNPLRPFRGDTTRISVKFEGADEKWAGYDPASVVTVHPAPKRLTRLALVDVDDPDRGLDRPVGTAGGHDSSFDTRVRHKVPDVTGLRYAEAVRRLAAEGLAVAYAGRGAPPDDAAVTGSDPGPGTELAFGRYVTLSVDTGETDGPQVPGASDSSGKGTAGPTDDTSRGQTGGSPTPSSGSPTPTTATSSGSSSPSLSHSSPSGHSSSTAGGSSSSTARSSPTAGGSSSSTARSSPSGYSSPSTRSSPTAGGSSSSTARSSPSARSSRSSPTAGGGSPSTARSSPPPHSSPTAGGVSSPTARSVSPTTPHGDPASATADGSPTTPHLSPTSVATGGAGASPTTGTT
ncbi:PASTA domain-containing protein [Streptomyces gibsoniae]|uniref:PASTA domain-containing protein n=1 Tax=Streptomyces gibsoniae TaxID=3075529 RepID=A0ABU2TLY3_9ACTN|nr:PASTA domain-containing protein [Streptomyces sp. DSM 41699]MDT0461942.1 PASTA domain-containing protein [Streptomyces sp. DSM 41699]